MTFLSTGQVADLLQVNLHRIEYLTRDRQIRPTKGPTGIFLWTFRDVCIAAKLLKITTPSEETFVEATNQRLFR